MNDLTKYFGAGKKIVSSPVHLSTKKTLPSSLLVSSGLGKRATPEVQSPHLQKKSRTIIEDDDGDDFANVCSSPVMKTKTTSFQSPLPPHNQDGSNGSDVSSPSPSPLPCPSSSLSSPSPYRSVSPSPSPCLSPMSTSSVSTPPRTPTTPSTTSSTPSSFHNNNTANRFASLGSHTPSSCTASTRSPLRLASPCPSSPATIGRSHLVENNNATKTKANIGYSNSSKDGRYDWLEHVKDQQGRTPEDPDYDPTSLYVPASAYAKMTPFERQFWDIKKTHWDCVVFFQKGRFFELYENDADVAAKELELKMTDRVNMRMCGVPEDHFAEWAKKLVDKGYKIVRVEETETALEAANKKKEKGNGGRAIIQREVSQVYTQGTLVDPSMLPTSQSSFLICIKEETGGLTEQDEIDGPSSPALNVQGKQMNRHLDKTASGIHYGICIVDAAVGAFLAGSFVDDSARTTLETILLQYPPREILLEAGGARPITISLIKRSALSTASNSPRAVPANITSRPSQGFDVTTGRDILSKTVMKCFLQEKQENEAKMNKQSSSSSSSTYSEKSTAIPRWRESLKQIESDNLALGALGACLTYLEELNLVNEVATLKRFQVLDVMGGSKFLHLDGHTLTNLEILQNTEGTTEGTLLKFLDRTRSAGGKRLFRQWVCHPLRHPAEINDRLDAVEDFRRCPELDENLSKVWARLPDLERLSSRAHSHSLRLPDFFSMLGGLRSLYDFVNGVPAQYLAQSSSDVFKSRRLRALLRLGPMLGLKQPQQQRKRNEDDEDDDDDDDVDDEEDTSAPYSLDEISTEGEGENEGNLGLFPNYDDILKHFENAFASTGLGGGIASMNESGGRGRMRVDCQASPNPGMDPDFDEAVEAITTIETKLDNFLQETRNRFHEPKIRYRSMGAEPNQLEIPVAWVNIHKNQLPDDFQLMSQTKEVMRYWTPYIRNLLPNLTEARSQRDNAARGFYRKILSQFSRYMLIWSTTAMIASEVDSLHSLAVVSQFVDGGASCRPIFCSPPADHRSFMEIQQLRHPCATMESNTTKIWVPNDVGMGGERPSIILLTGANMAGKSAFMKECCVAVIMAQLGCYIPAEQCRLTPCDRIFVRSGASDNIGSHMSTFMVELQETATMLREATPQSLVVLDELGRGTSTYDGYAIAYAVLQHLATHLKCRTLFSTHHHSLTVDLAQSKEVRTCHMLVHTEGRNDVTFLYKVADGVSPRSFGMNVARMAGLVDRVIERADQLSRQFEETDIHSLQHRAKELLVLTTPSSSTSAPASTSASTSA
nr:DNA mismatch repair protein MSH6 [Paratrimastix eleionoma]